MFPTKKVVVATHNAHKLDEIRSILAIPGWEFVSLEELGIFEEPVENADSFVGNARIKARFAHAKTGLASLADDSGLSVDALEGAPGVYSSRYAGEDSDDTANNAKLLMKMKGVAEENRTAHFICTIVFIDSDGSEIVAAGALNGRIGHELRGSNGFGYDPLFYLESDGLSHTVAELRAAEKNMLSHRSRALMDLRDKLTLDNRVPKVTSPTSKSKRQIVAFDFDGTLIDTSSPVRLITRLNRDRIMSKWAVLKSIVWGARYKLGMELDQTVPRRHVFSSFKDFPASEANAIMQDVYQVVLRKHLRPQAIAALKEHQAKGKKIIIVSASFDPIISELCKDLDIKEYICTQMEIVQGSYTGETAGNPPESEHKLLQFVAWADSKYGPDGWELSYAYGDHYSDVPLMEIAKHPIAIDPDHRLRHIAKERGWEIHDWPLK